MEGSELEQWDSFSIGTVCADENNLITLGDDDCTVEIEAEFQHPMSMGALLTRRTHCDQGHCHEEPICIIWRYPCLN
jgi:hypothetical protein